MVGVDSFFSRILTLGNKVIDIFDIFVTARYVFELKRVL